MFIIEFIHYNHFIYNDLKPDNIMIDKNNFVVLIDFDIMIQENEMNKIEVSDSENYIAPEVLDKTNITYYGDIYSIGKIIEFINFKKNYEKNTNNNELLSILSKLLNKNIELRPSLYGMIHEIKDSCQSEIDDYVYDFLFKLNFDTAQENIKLIEKDPYLKINLGYILLEKQKDISKNYQGHELFKSINEKYKEVEYVLNKIFNLQAHGSNMIDNTIFYYVTSFPGENNFDDKNIQKLYNDSNQNDINAKFYLGMLHLKLINNKKLTKIQFQYILNCSYEDYLNKMRELEEIIKSSERFALNIPVGIKYLEEAAKNEHVNALFVLGIINIAKI